MPRLIRNLLKIKKIFLSAFWISDMQGVKGKYLFKAIDKIFDLGLEKEFAFFFCCKGRISEGPGFRV